MNSKFYNLSVRNPKGEPINMSQFEGQVVLVVNTATKCGLAPQFKGLEDLHQKYKNQGLVVLGFPCNQFANQEPETNDTVVAACELNFGVSFQLTEKIRVNGENTHPIFNYLKDEHSGTFGKKIKWNFTKFLINKEGKAFKRYAPATKPKKLEKDIQKLLAE